VAVVGAEAFAVGGEPGADDLVFCAGEEDVAVFGVSWYLNQIGFLGSVSFALEMAHLIWVRDRSYRSPMSATALNAEYDGATHMALQ